MSINIYISGHEIPRKLTFKPGLCSARNFKTFQEIKDTKFQEIWKPARSIVKEVYISGHEIPRNLAREISRNLKPNYSRGQFKIPRNSAHEISRNLKSSYNRAEQNSKKFSARNFKKFESPPVDMRNCKKFHEIRYSTKLAWPKLPRN